MIAMIATIPPQSDSVCRSEFWSHSLPNSGCTSFGVAGGVFPNCRENWRSRLRRDRPRGARVVDRLGIRPQRRSGATVIGSATWLASSVFPWRRSGHWGPARPEVGRAVSEPIAMGPAMRPTRRGSRFRPSRSQRLPGRGHRLGSSVRFARGVAAVVRACSA
jgi:hypothetical protein